MLIGRKGATNNGNIPFWLATLSPLPVVMERMHSVIKKKTYAMPFSVLPRHRRDNHEPLFYADPMVG